MKVKAELSVRRTICPKCGYSMMLEEDKIKEDVFYLVCTNRPCELYQKRFFHQLPIIDLELQEVIEE